ncbi:unnamed protein product [Candida verbasci]|uniref:Carboxypeptidase n=1 Tax=Candida verbasci TaxID=1227364 RepID=A0A9W4U2F9_9ASCO|nr:unnamed protein product [Candida verbasci]
MSVLLLLLFLTNFISALPPKLGTSSPDSTSKYLVTDLPGLYFNIPKDEIPLMFSGQLEVDKDTETSYFFWKFEDNKKIFTNRTTFWLNGGPGCSSMDGALLETGPFRINSDKKVTHNNGSWHKLSDMIYVDQPGGVGFSKTSEYLRDLDQISDYFLKFMDAYFNIFPDEINNDIYLSGESYAGQYIPYIAQGILNRKEGNKYNLKGLLIGNGWVSPNEQSLSYLPFFVDKKLIDTNNPQWLTILKTHENCQKIVNKIDSTFKDGQIHDYEIDSGECESILNKLLRATNNHGESCINIYDYNLRDSYPSCGMSWPNELSNVYPFLRSDEVMNDLNLQYKKEWVECNGRVGGHFKARNSVPSIHLFPELLQQIPIILFNGANDIVCNSVGVLSYIKKLSWGGVTGFQNDTNQIDWIYNDSSVGYILQERNLSFINIENSSHMVPYDLPDVSRALMDLITENYDKRDNNGKTEFVTYPFGHRKEKVPDLEPKPKPEEIPTPATSSTSSSSTTTESITKESSSSTSTSLPDSSTEPTGSKITRLIQLGVILILIWGIYILYSSYKSRPSSIIKKPKKKSSKKKKKNVQWSDQLNNFDDDSDGIGSPSQKNNGGFLSKLNPFQSNQDNKYNRINNQYTDDIELNENLDDFIIASNDDETENGNDRNNNDRIV